MNPLDNTHNFSFHTAQPLGSATPTPTSEFNSTTPFWWQSFYALILSLIIFHIAMLFVSIPGLFCPRHILTGGPSRWL